MGWLFIPNIWENKIVPNHQSGSKWVCISKILGLWVLNDFEWFWCVWHTAIWKLVHKEQWNLIDGNWLMALRVGSLASTHLFWKGGKQVQAQMVGDQEKATWYVWRQSASQTWRETNTARTLELVPKTIGQVPLPSDNLTYSSYSQSLSLKGKSTINEYKRPCSIAIPNSRAGFPTKTNPVGRWPPTSSGGASLAVGFRTQVSTWPSARRPTMVS